MARKQKAGWALIALAGAMSTGIAVTEILSLVGQADAESSETLPVIGFVPSVDD
ncbi:unannotated protein [freshwater metagenome]|uniref:Unannotated protein n=1 Tax=freshwater metagenome TaxID=449393 RepID=A0A6J6DI21_9ZZZZ|nr:hypothetical protein [Actinomycetota bacterium]